MERTNIVFKKQSIAGFTLIELLISVGIFSVAIAIAAGGFAQALRGERQTSTLLAANSNASLVIEQMAREIRTGKNFCTNGTTCLSSSILSFVNAKGQTVTYCLANNTINRAVDSSCGIDSGQKLTARNINISYLGFRILGNQNNDGYPPRITILIGISPNEPQLIGNVINLQTTVSSRILDG